MILLGDVTKYLNNDFTKYALHGPLPCVALHGPNFFGNMMNEHSSLSIKFRD
jgi:hypothetical protein